MLGQQVLCTSGCEHSNSRLSIMTMDKGICNVGCQPPVPIFDPLLKKSKYINKYVVGCSLLACMTTILLGYDMGVMSGAIIFIQEDFHLSEVQKEVIMGILSLYSLIGALAAGLTSDWIGRRYTVVLAGVIFFIGALLMGFATNFAFLMVGRFVAGIGVGYAGMIASVYTTEIAPASYRGMLASFPEVFINFGILLGYVSNLAFSKLPKHLGWRFMLGIATVPSAIIAVAVLTMPESPRWLVMQGRLGEAKKVLSKISESDEEAKLRLSDIKQAAGIPEHSNDNVVSIDAKKHRGEGVWRELFVHPTLPVRHVLLCALGIYFFHQACGSDSVVLYSPEIFKRAGITDATHQLLATMSVGVFKTIFIIIAICQLDRLGRRLLLLTSVAGIVASLLGLGIGLTIVEKVDHKIVWPIGLCIASALLFVAFFSIGLGPIMIVYCSEIFPLRLRAQGCSIGMALNRVISAVVSMTFLLLTKAVTIGGAFFLYSGIAAIGWVFFFTLYPETRGKTLEEMEMLFGSFFKWRSNLKAINKKKVEGVKSERGLVV